MIESFSLTKYLFLKFLIQQSKRHDVSLKAKKAKNSFHQERKMNIYSTKQKERCC